MSNRAYGNNNITSATGRARNPFDDDNNDQAFGNRKNTASGAFNLQDDDEDLKRIQERIGRVENDSLESTMRTLRTLNETHEVGVSAAQELVRQGEQLKGIDERLDNVNTTLTSTQKNLNQIKSVFGGLKNRFVNWKSYSQSSDVPATASLKTSSSSTSVGGQRKPFDDTAATATGPAEFAKITGSDREQELNKNLDEISKGLTQLNSLARGMQVELDRQNPLLDRLNGKVERTHGKISDQNSEMKRILK